MPGVAHLDLRSTHNNVASYALDFGMKATIWGNDFSFWDKGSCFEYLPRESSSPTSNRIGDPCIFCSIFLNQGVFGSLI